ncbi:MAG: LysM peptidoglycan-binding domain-containing protein [Candidatus Promineifilaceae bacterium]
MSLLVLAVLAGTFFSVVEAQELPTATPDAEGIIYVVVQPDDSLWGIAARAGLTIPELLALNDLDESVVLQPGDRLIVARVEPPATATSSIPTPTLPPPTPTATAVQLRTAICFIAYKDLNQDGHFDPGEPSRPSVAFTIYNEQEVVTNYVTDGLSEPHCLENLTPGVYHVTRSVGKNETLTTEGDWALTLGSGTVLNLAFGSFDGRSQGLEPTLSADEQLSTRVVLTPAATPTTAPTATPASISRPTLMAGLAVAILALLASTAVLTLLFVRRHRAD